MTSERQGEFGRAAGVAGAEAAARRVAAFYENLAPASLDALGEIYADDARFKDPFNEVAGIRAIRGIFEHMFATVAAPRFRVSDSIAQGEQAMLGWAFHLELRGQPVVIRGVTHLRFDGEGKVVLHRDYWDAAEELYEKLPLLGGLMRLIRRRLSATGDARAGK